MIKELPNKTINLHISNVYLSNKKDLHLMKFFQALARVEPFIHQNMNMVARKDGVQERSFSYFWRIFDYSNNRNSNA